mgnify:CR=1 FL=1
MFVSHYVSGVTPSALYVSGKLPCCIQGGNHRKQVYVVLNDSQAASRWVLIAGEVTDILPADKFEQMRAVIWVHLGKRLAG